MRKFQHYLIDSLGRSYFKENNLIKSGAARRYLPLSPKGWDEIALAWERDILGLLGMNRSVTLPLSFSHEGADIIRDQYLKKRIDPDLYLLITRHQFLLTDTTYRNFYKFFYKGEPDFSTFKDDGTQVTVNIGEGGIHKKIKSNLVTTFQVPVSDQSINVKTDGIYLYFKKRFSMFADSFSAGVSELGDGDDIRNYLPSFMKTNEEGTTVNLVSLDVNRTELPNVFDLATMDGDFMRSVDVVEVESVLRFNFKVTKTPTGNGGHCKVKVYKNTGALVATIADIAFTGAGYNQTFNVELPVNFTLAADEKLFYVVETRATKSILSPVPVLVTIAFTESHSDFSYKSKYRQTITKWEKPSVVFKQAIKEITGDENNADTTYIEQFDHLVIASGDRIRGIDSPVKTNLEKFLGFCRVLMAGGFGIINKKAVVKARAALLDRTNTRQLLQVKNLVYSEASDLRPNRFKFGYVDRDIDDVNGKFEFNNTYEWQAPFDGPDKAVEFVCPYYGQPYVIETIRATLDGKTTTDSSADNEIFVAAIDLNNPEVIDGITVYPLLRPAFTSIEGIPDTTNIFNLTISPKRIMELHRREIDSLMDGFDGKYLKFKATTKNQNLKTVLGADVVDEDQNYKISKDKYYQMVYIDIDTEGDTDLVDIMDTDPNVCFEFGAGVAGFPTKCGLQPDSRQEQGYRLLASTDTDLKNIHKNAYK